MVAKFQSPCFPVNAASQFHYAVSQSKRFQDGDAKTNKRESCFLSILLIEMMYLYHLRGYHFSLTSDST